MESVQEDVVWLQEQLWFVLNFIPFNVVNRFKRKWSVMLGMPEAEAELWPVPVAVHGHAWLAAFGL